MPMMRRGPLDRYPAESVIRQAAAHGVNGGIEFHTTSPATFFFQNGRLYASAAGITPAAAEDSWDRFGGDEDRTRRAAVALLASTLAADTGWYFHDPLARHGALDSWSWETASILIESRAITAATPTPPVAAMVATPAGDPDPNPDPMLVHDLGLLEATTSSISLGPDAWSIVVALAGTLTTVELQEQLGWTQGRMATALGELERRGVLHAAPPNASPAPIEVPAGTLDPDGRHVGPLAPPPAQAPAPADTTPGDEGRSRLLRRRKAEVR